MTKELQRLGRLLYPPGGPELRPQTRADCADEERPCVFVSCKYNLYLDVNSETGTIKFNFPDIEPEDMLISCALDVADDEGCVLEEVGMVMNLTRERVRQLEESALRKVRDTDAAVVLEQDSADYLAGRSETEEVKVPIS